MTNKLVEQRRSFIVGSEWLYYNIYLGPQTSDKFLMLVMSPLTKILIEEKIIDKWFYIRYKDGKGYHLRVRFHLCNDENNGNVILRFHDLIMPFFQQRLIYDITINTYKRELERYGFETIEEFESLFFISTELILKLITLTEDSQENRWLYGMKSIDTFLDSCCYSLEQKKKLLDGIKTSFGNEFGADKEIRRQLSKKYRNNKKKIETLFNEKNNEIESLLSVFREESKVYFAIIVDKIKLNDFDKSLVIDDLVGSYLHMHCNRLFQSKNRKTEWVVYNLLYEYYYSKIARLKSYVIKKEVIK